MLLPSGEKAVKAIFCPSGENATDLIPAWWPLSVSNSLPLATSHTFAVSSPLPVTIRLPSGETATDQIAATLHLSRETVRNYVRQVLRALGAHSRLEAVALAHQEGLLGREDETGATNP